MHFLDSNEFPLCLYSKEAWIEAQHMFNCDIYFAVSVSFHIQQSIDCKSKPQGSLYSPIAVLLGKNTVW